MRGDAEAERDIEQLVEMRSEVGNLRRAPQIIRGVSNKSECSPPNLLGRTAGDRKRRASND
jgi:hypothetical protein